MTTENPENLALTHEDVVAAFLFPGMMTAAQRGVSPQKAMRALVTACIEASLGSAAWKELGVAQSTAERWRRDLRDAFAGADLPDEVPAEIQETYTRLRLEKIAKDQRRAQRMGA